MKLVVTFAFGDHRPGDEIVDSEEIALVLGENPGSVVKVATSAPAPAAADAPSASSTDA